MPAKKKPAPKAPAKSAKKAPAKPAPKKPAKPAKPAPKKPAKAAKPAPKKSAKPAAKPAPNPKAKTPVVKKVVKSAAKKSPPIVKKAPAKAAPPAKKAPAKPAPAAKKPAAKAPAPAPVKKVAVKAAPAPAPKAAAPAAKPEPAKKGAPAKSSVPVAEKPATKANNGPLVKIINAKRTASLVDDGITMEAGPKKPVLPAAFLKKQRIRLIELRDLYMSAAEGVANESLRNNDGNESAFGMHQADAGSDAYDRDFALSLLAKEQDAIYEINEALKRIDFGTYGICEMSADLISEERLEALPFTRFTVACQGRLESEQRSGRWNRPVRSLFGLDESAEDADDDKDEEESTSTTTQTSNNGNESLDFSKE